MEKRALLAIFLCLLIWFSYQYYFAPPQTDIPKPEPTASRMESPGLTEQAPLTERIADGSSAPMEKPAPEPALPESVLETGKSEPPSAASAGALPIPIEPESAAAPERRITIETPLYRAVFTTRGVVPVSWRLKRYNDNGSDEFHQLLPENVTGELLPLRTEFTRKASLPFADAVYEYTGANEIVLNADRPQSTLIFRSSRGDIEMRKSLTFYADRYVFEQEVAVLNRSAEPIGADYEMLLGGEIKPEVRKKSSRYVGGGPVAFINGKRTVLKDSKDSVLRVYDGTIPWAALTDVYFAMVLQPEPADHARIQFQTIRKGDKETTPVFRLSYNMGAADLPAGHQVTDKYQWYFGPMEFDRLKRQGGNMEDVIRFGFFGFLAKPLLMILKFTYRYIGNYGLAIIILTILIKIIFLPLSVKQMSSMKKMQEIQPKVNALRSKYKKDTQKMNEEVMKLYKEHKVNPMGGCLPMVFQIPVFFALYQVLLAAIELRQAPFFLWIQDLSAPDPIYVTPILMGISMFIQQKMTPTAGDPKQAQMFQFMPILFTFLFLNFPTGLVIYWLANNLLTIGQQLVTRSLFGGSKADVQSKAVGNTG